MKHEQHVTLEQAAQCLELARSLTQEPQIWPKYVRLCKDLEGVDIDAEFNSKPVKNYIIFMGNHVRVWLRSKAPEIDRDTDLLYHFQKLITDEAQLEY